MLDATIKAKGVLAAKARQEQLTKTPGSLGRVEQIAIAMAGVQVSTES